MAFFQARTDLALEAREYVEDANGELRGVIVDEYDKKDIGVSVTKVRITTKNSAKLLGKPKGTYITLEVPGLCECGENGDVSENHEKVAAEISEHIKELLPEDWLKKIYYQDDLGAWKRKKVFFYYTGINAMLIHSECAVEKIEEVLTHFKNHPEVVLWWMPCRMDGEMLEILHDYAPDMKARYEAVMQKYQQENWGIYDVSGNVSRAIDMSDAYYGDKGLLVPVYKATGKKIMYQHYHVENLIEIISSQQ